MPVYTYIDQFSYIYIYIYNFKLIYPTLLQDIPMNICQCHFLSLSLSLSLSL